MKQYQTSHRFIVIERIAVALSFFCMGICMGLLIAPNLPARFFASRSNAVFLFVAMVFLLIWPAMLLLSRLQRGHSKEVRSEGDSSSSSDAS